MKMIKFHQNKLFRDLIPQIMKARGSILHYFKLTPEEHDKHVRLKLVEEAHEVLTASSREELVKELADVFEVIDTVCALHKLTKEEIQATQEKKRAEQGGFMQGYYITIAEHPAGSSSEAYCRAQPEKYPEVEGN